MVRALIASGFLPAPQLGKGTALLIQQLDHIGTQVPLLVIFLVLDPAQYSPGGTTPCPPLNRWPASFAWYPTPAFRTLAE
jgi:hypothetical protein